METSGVQFPTLLHGERLRARIGRAKKREREKRAQKADFSRSAQNRFYIE
jgi:hypothetical protein